MRYLGIILFAVGTALFVFVIYTRFIGGKSIISPIPADNGTTVLFITPTK